MTDEGAPLPRMNAQAVWTGSKAIFFGGSNARGSTYSIGKAYVPADDRWEEVVQASVPLTRSHGSFVWTGSQLVVWGGMFNGHRTLSSGGILTLE